MNNIQLFLPCAGGVEPLLQSEVRGILRDTSATDIEAMRGGVMVRGSWRDAMMLNLHSRLAQRVLIQISRTPYASEHDLYDAAHAVAWEMWFTPKQSFRIDITAQKSPLKSLNFAALRVKDAIVDRFRNKFGMRPNVDTAYPDVRVYVHLTNDRMSLSIDTSGEPLFKRGWREDKGDAPLKETLAAAMIAASGWKPGQVLYDPCCGSGTIVIEAAQIALNIAPGSQRRFGFERLAPYQAHVWQGIRQNALAQQIKPADAGPVQIFGSDVAHRMVDFAQRNAERAGVSAAVELRGGDALQRMPPAEASAQGAVLLLNPPYGERIEVRGVAGRGRDSGRDFANDRGREMRSPAPLTHAQTREAFEGGDSANQFFESWLLTGRKTSLVGKLMCWFPT
jgi:putative N6-adenine-specific DNA methylase